MGKEQVESHIFDSVPVLKDVTSGVDFGRKDFVYFLQIAYVRTSRKKGAFSHLTVRKGIWKKKRRNFVYKKSGTLHTKPISKQKRKLIATTNVNRCFLIRLF